MALTELIKALQVGHAIAPYDKQTIIWNAIRVKGSDLTNSHLIVGESNFIFNVVHDIKTMSTLSTEKEYLVL